ncbi:hypothetical protein V7O61_11805 [Methanolobus sp. WCC1]|uniref:hypothetical protein n=1 Tax=unclassified Methanolobus TaxID=2629569 RepID=UPI00324E18F4
MLKKFCKESIPEYCTDYSVLWENAGFAGSFGIIPLIVINRMRGNDLLLAFSCLPLIFNGRVSTETKITDFKYLLLKVEFMTSVIENLKEKIEEMQNTKISNSEETILDKVKREQNDEWTENHVEAIVNTVLAMRQNWERTAEPRFVEYQKNYSHITSLEKMKNLIKGMDEKEFCNKVLGLNITTEHFWRYEMLQAMIDAFVEYQKENELESDKEAMLKWAKEFDYSNENDPIRSIKNVGIATVQNLRMCLGIDTVKPDVHVKNALKEIGLGNEIQICELISELTDISCRELDQIFWLWAKTNLNENLVN